MDRAQPFRTNVTARRRTKKYGPGIAAEPVVCVTSGGKLKMVKSLPSGGRFLTE